MAFYSLIHIGAALTATSTAADFTLGTKTVANDGSEWLFVKNATAALSAGQVMVADTALNVTLLEEAGAKKRSGPIGFAQNAVGTGEYFWMATKGENLQVILSTTAAASGHALTGTALCIASAASTAAGKLVSQNSAEALIPLIGVGVLTPPTAAGLAVNGQVIVNPHIS